MGSGIFRTPTFQKYSFAKIPNLLQCPIRSPSVFVDLPKEEIKQGSGQFEGVGSVVPPVFVDRFLMPWIELPCRERIVHSEEDLRSGHDDAHFATSRVQDPYRNRVVRVGPKETDRADSGPLNEKGVKRRQFVILGRRSWNLWLHTLHRLPLAPDLVRVRRHIRDRPMHIP
jgi:hypothetical protein